MRAPALILSLFLLSSLGRCVAFAEEGVGPDPDPQMTPEPMSSPVDLDQSFLLLPAFDLERVGNGPIRVGDELELKVVGLTSPIASVAVPPGTEDLTEAGWDLDVKQGTSGDIHLSAAVLKAGRNTLPSLSLMDASGKAVARTNPQSFNVESAISPDDPKKEESAAPAPPVSAGFPRWVIYVSIALGVLFLGGIGYLIWRWVNRKSKAASKPVEPPKSEDEVALKILLELEKQGLIHQGHFKKYYFKVSETLKEYVGRRYDFDARECTTLELIRNLETRPGAIESWVHELRSLFEEMDVIKFTDVHPVDGAAEKVLERSRKWILQTRRIPTVMTSEVSRAP